MTEANKDAWCGGEHLELNIFATPSQVVIPKERIPVNGWG